MLSGFCVWLVMLRIRNSLAVLVVALVATSASADTFGVSPGMARADAAPAATCWLAHDTDHIESWAPFSNVPTHIRLSVDGISKWYGQ